MRNGYVMFALGMPPHVFGLALIPVSVFYLTLERICIIRFPTYYTFQKPKFLYVFYALTICVGVFSVSYFGFYQAFLLLKPEMRISLFNFRFTLNENFTIFSACLINGCILGAYVEVSVHLMLNYLHLFIDIFGMASYLRCF